MEGLIMPSRMIAATFVTMLLMACCLAQQPAPENAAADQASETATREQLRSPRATMKTFLAATSQENFALATECMDFSALDLLDRNVDRANYAWMLREVIDRLATVDLESISDEPNAEPYRYPTGQAYAPIVIDRDVDGAWRFTAGTVGQVRQLYTELRSLPRYADRAFWQRVVPYTNNEVWQWAWLIAAIVIAIFLGRFQRHMLSRWADRLEARGRTLTSVALRAVARSASAAIVVVGLKVGIEALTLPPLLADWMPKVLGSLIVMTIGYVAWCLVDVAARWAADLSAGRLDDMLVPFVTKSLRCVVVVLALVQVATVLTETPATSLIAGLGIGGLAIGLAAQDTIKNLFGSLMIFGDRPFELGDRIVVDGRDGPVHSVGLRSTRIRTGDGLVTIPNGDLANKPILNIGKPAFLKRAMNVRLSYANTPAKVQRAVAILREILHEHEGHSPQRPASVFFNDITDTAFNIAATYFFSPPDGARFAALNERINLEILDRFEREGIELAAPNQTLIVTDDARPPQVLPARREPAEGRET
jgi:MscS family membrane protein